MAEPPPVPLAHPSGPLAGYRVLDFADEKGQLCARLLAELGADVIKVEPPREGDPTRQRGPFYRSEAGAESSLYWWTMNAGKRSITCQLRLNAGRDLVHRLVAQADMVVETNAPGRAADLGLDYATLREVNPSLVAVSITNFGLTGPYKDWQATDIVGVAMGGHMYLNGDEDHGPVRTLAPQAYTQVNVQAAVGATTALYARGVNGGLGQQVDVSMQEAVANAMDNAQATWDISRKNLSGPGLRRNTYGTVVLKYLYEARDGWVAALNGGPIQGPNGQPLIDWMAETGEAAPIDQPAWRERLLSQAPLDADEMAVVEGVIEAFCRTRGKVALVEEAQRRGGGWAPVFSPREIVEARHLKERDYWIWVRHEEMGESFLYPGAPWKLSATPWMQRGRAPHVGEHNEDVYSGMLGIDEAELRRLRTRMVI